MSILAVPAALGTTDESSFASVELVGKAIYVLCNSSISITFLTRLGGQRSLLANDLSPWPPATWTLSASPQPPPGFSKSETFSLEHRRRTTPDAIEVAGARSHIRCIEAKDTH